MQLTEAGERQASCLAGRLAGSGIDAIHSSPRERAIRTAEAIAARTGAAVDIADALDEIDFGDWTGMSFEELEGQQLWRHWNESRAIAAPPNGESMVAAQGRVVAHAEEIGRTRPGTRVVLVSHSDVLRGLVAHVLGLPLDRLLRFEIDPASVSRVEVGTRGARVLSLNETAPGTAHGTAQGANGAAT